ncbi:MAG: SHOCT domain-containing protein [Armatimonadota bacterium]|nr:SHOCT domain-containing protein [Armatimonadota bacterium]
MKARDIGIVVLVVLGVLILVPLLTGGGRMAMGPGFGYGPGMMGPGMMGGQWGGRWGFGWMPLAGGLFWLLIIIGVVLVVTSLVRRDGTPAGPAAGEAPLDVLKRRLAAGEITLEEYEKVKKELT